MRLSRRNLKLELTGDDVRLLQSELIQLGLPIPKPEQERGAFLQGTHEAVLRFQREHRLTPRGIVDRRTAEAINRAVSAQAAPRGVGEEAAATTAGGANASPSPEPPAGRDGYTVVGTVTSPDRPGVGGLRVQIV